MDMQNDFERLLFFEHARRGAEAAYASNPLDADNLTRWGGFLLELSTFQHDGEQKHMVKDAIAKFDEALLVNPKKHDAMWYLGNANTSFAFLTPDKDEAKPYFDLAFKYFEQALEEDPSNDLYRKSFEMALKAPELHLELHKKGQQIMGPGAGSGPSTSTSARGLKAKKSSDLKYDICGWIILAVGIFVWVGFAKSNMPPPPPPPR